MPELKFSKHSLRDKMLAWALLFILPILAMIGYTGIQASRAYEQQMHDSMTQILRQYAAEIDSVLSEARRYVVNKQINLREWESADELRRLQAISEAGQAISEELSLHTQVDAAFVFSESQSRINFIQNYNRPYPESRQAAAVLQEQLSGRSRDLLLYPQGFLHFTAGDHTYLYVARDIPGGVFGCWFDVETLFVPLKGSGLDGIEKIMLADRGGVYLDKDFSTRSTKRLQQALRPYFLTSEQLSTIPYRLTVLWNPNVVYAPVRTWLMRSGYFSIVFAFLLFIAYMVILQFSLVRPLNRLAGAIGSIEPDSRKPIAIPRHEPTEILNVYTALNSMISEIDELKIRVYEERLVKQNTQMQLFQLQIRPHFFLNALNTVISFARAGNYEQVRRMAQYLARHCRYVLYNNWFVTLQDELEYTQNYVKMLSLQRETDIAYDISVQDRLLDLEIPILSLQIFVENSLKYANIQQEALAIHVDAERQTVPNGELLHLSIRDTGAGFDPQTLAVLNDPKIEEHYGRDHGIGIANIRQRLKILYEGRADVAFSNSPDGGARVELFLPIRHQKGGEDG